MERGTMEHTLPLDHCVGTEGAVSTAVELSKIGP